MDLSEIEQWADGCLTAAGRRRTGPLTVFRSRPWADVLSAPTDAGAVWVKLPGAGTRFEVGLYDVLRRAAPEVIVDPLGIDAAEGRLLLPDAGPSLGQDYDDMEVADLAAAMTRYGSAQLVLGEHVDALLATGVEDMRPSAMPDRFDEAIAAARRFVESRGVDADRRLLLEVESLRSRFSGRCAELAGRPGDPTLDHNDLHALNILGRGRSRTWAIPTSCVTRSRWRAGSRKSLGPSSGSGRCARRARMSTKTSPGRLSSTWRRCARTALPSREEGGAIAGSRVA